jgi:hypothetical protein
MPWNECSVMRWRNFAGSLVSPARPPIRSSSRRLAGELQTAVFHPSVSLRQATSIPGRKLHLERALTDFASTRAGVLVVYVGFCP